MFQKRTQESLDRMMTADARLASADVPANAVHDLDSPRAVDFTVHQTKLLDLTRSDRLGASDLTSNRSRDAAVDRSIFLAENRPARFTPVRPATRQLFVG